MSQTRVPVEWLFNEIETYFKFVSYTNICLFSNSPWPKFREMPKKPKSEPAIVARLGLSDFAKLATSLLQIALYNKFMLYNELVILSFPSFPFIVFFSQVFWSKLAILLKFFSNERNENQPLLNYAF